MLSGGGGGAWPSGDVSGARKGPSSEVFEHFVTGSKQDPLTIVTGVRKSGPPLNEYVGGDGNGRRPPSAEHVSGGNGSGNEPPLAFWLFGDGNGKRPPDNRFDSIFATGTGKLKPPTVTIEYTESTTGGNGGGKEPPSYWFDRFFTTGSGKRKPPNAEIDQKIFNGGGNGNEPILTITVGGGGSGHGFGSGDIRPVPAPESNGVSERNPALQTETEAKESPAQGDYLYHFDMAGTFLAAIIAGFIVYKFRGK